MRDTTAPDHGPACATMRRCVPSYRDRFLLGWRIKLWWQIVVRRIDFSLAMTSGSGDKLHEVEGRNHPLQSLVTIDNKDAMDATGRHDSCDVGDGQGRDYG